MTCRFKTARRRKWWATSGWLFVKKRLRRTRPPAYRENNENGVAARLAAAINEKSLRLAGLEIFLEISS